MRDGVGKFLRSKYRIKKRKRGIANGLEPRTFKNVDVIPSFGEGK